MPDSPLLAGRIRRGPRPSPIRPSSIPGNRVNPWPSQWHQLCAGPRKPRENPSLMLPLRVLRPRLASARSGAQSGLAGKTALPQRRHVPGKFQHPIQKAGLEPAASAIAVPCNRRDQGDQEDRGSIRERWLEFEPSIGGRRSTEAFAALDGERGLRRRRQQEDPADCGVVDRTRGRRLFRLDQNAVRTSATGSATIRSSRKFGVGCAARATSAFTSETQSATGEVVTQPDQDLSGTTAVPARPSLPPRWSRRHPAPRLRFRPRRRQRKMKSRSSEGPTSSQNRTIAGVSSPEWLLHPAEN